MSVVPYMGFCFYILEFLKSKCILSLWINNCIVGDSPTKNSVYGTISGAVSKILVYPLDTGKKVLQVYRIAPKQQPLSIFLREHFAETGVKGLYAGVVAATLKSGISSGLLFGIYAFSKSILKQKQE